MLTRLCEETCLVLVVNHLKLFTNRLKPLKLQNRSRCLNRLSLCDKDENPIKYYENHRNQET